MQLKRVKVSEMFSKSCTSHIIYTINRALPSKIVWHIYESKVARVTFAFHLWDKSQLPTDLQTVQKVQSYVRPTISGVACLLITGNGHFNILLPFASYALVTSVCHSTTMLASQLCMCVVIKLHMTYYFSPYVI